MAGKTPSQVSQWLFSQLAGLFPDWLKSLFFGTPAATILRFSENAKRISGEKGMLVAPEGMLEENAEEPKPVRKKIVDIVLPQSCFLKRVITAPKTARHNLHNLAELDMVRQTPFRTDMVFWSLSRPEMEDNRVKVAQWILKRTDTNAIRKRLKRAGLEVRRIFVEGEKLQKPIADFSAEIVPHAKHWRLVNAMLVFLGITIASFIWLFPAWQNSGILDRLQQENARLQSQAVDMRQNVEVLRQKENERAAFLDMIYMRPRLSDILRNLTVALGDNVWVSDLNYSPKRVVFSGEVSGSAAQLVLLLAKRREFNNPRLTGPVSRTGSGAERFEITLDPQGVQ